MWKDPRGDLDSFVRVNNTLQIESLVVAEWNMNDFERITKYGTYRNRPHDPQSPFYKAPTEYDQNDEGNYYTDAHKSIFTFADFVQDDDEPVLFESDDVNRSLYFDLEECFQPFRPRSGINKALFFSERYVDDVKSARRPRYYMSSRYDNFKYWNSYRTQIDDKRGENTYQVFEKSILNKPVSLNKYAVLNLGSHDLLVGDTIYVFNVDQYINGTWVITERTSETITFDLKNVPPEIDFANVQTEGTVRVRVSVEEFGVSFNNNPQGFTNEIGYFINDTAPFVVYENPMPANRVVVKIQTNLADSDSERNIRGTSDQVILDPLQDRSKSSIPQRWRIEYLDEKNTWTTAISFDENSTRKDGSPIVNWDGHVEIAYGIQVPPEFKDSFNLVDYIDSANILPLLNNNGDAYIVGSTETNPGTLYIWNDESQGWVQQNVVYGFSLFEEDDTQRIGLIKKLSDPLFYRDANNEIVYKDLVFLRGLRVVVDTMVAKNMTFDLIELSPRLRADLSDQTESYSFVKSIANDQSNIPVGGLLASNGDINLMNYDGAFTFNNGLRFLNGIEALTNPRVGSIVAKYLKPNVKFIFYEAVLNVNGYDKFIPMKTLYSESFPVGAGGVRDITVPLRDFFFRFESLQAPSLFLTNVSLTTAVTLLMDSIGFSNFVFKGFDELNFSDLSGEQTLQKINELRLLISQLEGRNGTLQQTLQQLRNSLENDVFTDLAREQLRGRIAEFEKAIAKNQREINSSLQTIENLENPEKFLQSIKDPTIPFFFVNPDSSVAQILIDLAVSTQSAMFFDEYNRLVIMPKEYILPDPTRRDEDLTLYGNTIKVGNVVDALPNIVEISNSESRILNDGNIQYTVRYIQREVTSVPQAGYIDQDKVYGYKPVLLWEVGASQETKTVNEEQKSGSSYTLGAAPLNSNLSAAVPRVVLSNGPEERRIIINNILDLGENVFWLPRFQGYLFANGEIIRYDAVEYNVSGTGVVWMTSNQQYQQYFGSLPFNGKIYPTGNVRIFAEPFYEEFEYAPETPDLDKNTTYKLGEVKRHGRGQFGTDIVEHSAGLPEYWSDNKNVRGCKMDSSYLFSTTPTERIVYKDRGTVGTPVGVNKDLAEKSSRNGVVKNYLRQYFPSDDVVKTLSSTQAGTVQSSAFVFSGAAEFPSEIAKRDFVSYVYKNLEAPYKHFGTRMRIIGGLKVNDRIQSPLNSSTYFNVEPKTGNDAINLDGGSGGIAVGVNPDTNHGYFFEICALTADNLEKYRDVDKETGAVDKVLHNVIFYKVVPGVDEGSPFAMPVKLWGGTAKIVVDEGLFVGMDRVHSQEIETVYDLSVEYETVGATRKFYLYINNVQVAIVIDADPLPEYTNMALFVRGSTECMFENVYALQNLMSKNTGQTIYNQISDSFGIDRTTSSSALRKYSMSGFIKSSYLTGISTQHSPNFRMYFEEFGTILREVGYFNIRYDQAYPALIAQIAPTFGQDKGYSVSGFYSGSYGAEFLVFNNNDRFLLLDETYGNYLRIIGVTFTQNIVEEFAVDDFLKERSSLSSPVVLDNEIRSPIAANKFFDDIKSSRKKYGKREFSLAPQYIQTKDDANEMMRWLIDKTFKQKLAVDLSVFGVPQLQLGDIVKIDYDLPEGVPFVDKDKKFVVYSMDQSKNATDLVTTLRVVEV
jgi:hypothetical protein